MIYIRNIVKCLQTIKQSKRYIIAKKMLYHFYEFYESISMIRIKLCFLNFTLTTI